MINIDPIHNQNNLQQPKTAISWITSSKICLFISSFFKNLSYHFNIRLHPPAQAQLYKALKEIDLPSKQLFALQLAKTLNIREPLPKDTLSLDTFIRTLFRELNAMSNEERQNLTLDISKHLTEANLAPLAPLYKIAKIQRIIVHSNELYDYHPSLSYLGLRSLFLRL